MKKFLFLSFLIFCTAPRLFAEMKVDLKAGYKHQGMYDMLYSPIIHEWNGFDCSLGFATKGKLISNRVNFNFYYLPAEFSNKKHPDGFDIYSHGKREKNYEDTSSWYISSCVGGRLSYAMDFLVKNYQDRLFFYLGPQLSANANFVGFETYCMDYSLELSSGLQYIFPNRHYLMLNISAAVLSFVNRPAYVMFDNQIMQNYEDNWMKELVHADKVTNIFSGDFYTFEMPVFYVIPLSDTWDVYFGYKGFIQYCSFPEKLIRIDHNLLAGAAMKF